MSSSCASSSDESLSSLSSISEESTSATSELSAISNAGSLENSDSTSDSTNSTESLSSITTDSSISLNSESSITTESGISSSSSSVVLQQNNPQNSKPLSALPVNENSESSETDSTLIDPINFSRMKDPVITPCGHLFDKDTICDWLKQKSTCPLCRNDIRKRDLTRHNPTRIKGGMDVVSSIELSASFESLSGSSDSYSSVSEISFELNGSMTEDDFPLEYTCCCIDHKDICTRCFCICAQKVDIQGSNWEFCVCCFGIYSRHTLGKLSSFKSRTFCGTCYPLWILFFLFFVFLQILFLLMLGVAAILIAPIILIAWIAIMLIFYIAMRIDNAESD